MVWGHVNLHLYQGPCHPTCPPLSILKAADDNEKALGHQARRRELQCRPQALKTRNPVTSDTLHCACCHHGPKRAQRPPRHPHLPQSRNFLSDFFALTETQGGRSRETWEVLSVILLGGFSCPSTSASPPMQWPGGPNQHHPDQSQPWAESAPFQGEARKTWGSYAARLRLDRVGSVASPARPPSTGLWANGFGSPDLFSHLSSAVCKVPASQSRCED